MNELRILEDQRGQAPARRYEALARKASRSGHEGVCFMTLNVLAARYYDDGERSRYRFIVSWANRLGDTQRPGNLAAVELERRLGVSGGVPPDHQTPEIQQTLAYEISLTRYARTAKFRIAEFRRLHGLALEQQKYLEAALCDLFLITEYRGLDDRIGEKSASADLKRLEKLFSVRAYDGRRYSETVAVRMSKSRRASAKGRSPKRRKAPRRILKRE